VSYYYRNLVVAEFTCNIRLKSSCKDIEKKSTSAVCSSSVVPTMSGLRRASISSPLVPAFQRFLSSHCPSSIPLFIIAACIPSYHVLLALPRFRLPGTIQLRVITKTRAGNYKIQERVLGTEQKKN
ncbi:hypothetical protein C0J52_16626, partial [Blattella germanica]